MVDNGAPILLLVKNVAEAEIIKRVTIVEVLDAKMTSYHLAF